MTEEVARATSDDLVRARWRKASYSNNGGNCVEVAPLPDGGTAVRDTKDRTGPVLRFGRCEWAAFLAAAKDGEFDRA